MDLNGTIMSKGPTQSSLNKFIFVLSIIIAVLIVISNLYIIICISTNKALKVIENVYILAISLINLSSGLVLLPIFAVVLLWGNWGICRTWLVLDTALRQITGLLLCIIVMDRYRAMGAHGSPLKHRSKVRVISQVALACVFGVMVTAGPLLFLKTKRGPLLNYDEESKTCYLYSAVEFSIYSLITYYGIPSLFLILMLVLILVAYLQDDASSHLTTDLKRYIEWYRGREMVEAISAISILWIVNKFIEVDVVRPPLYINFVNHSTMNLWFFINNFFTLPLAIPIILIAMTTDFKWKKLKQVFGTQRSSII